MLFGHFLQIYQDSFPTKKAKKKILELKGNETNQLYIQI